jgi:hypothetical protein
MAEEETKTETVDATKDELTSSKWLESLDEKSRGFYNETTQGLKRALDSERSERKEIEKKLHDLAAKAEKGSEMESKLSAVAAQFETEGRKSRFYEQAASKGVSNLRLAWVAANDGEMLTRSGDVDFEALKKHHPELFKTVVSANGAGRSGDKPKDEPHSRMNDFIRTAGGK